MAERHQSAVAQVSNEIGDYHMTENVTISLTSELVQKIDRLRRNVPRSRFILDALQDYLSHNDRKCMECGFLNNPYPYDSCVSCGTKLTA
jgi:hypothetical protein